MSLDGLEFFHQVLSHSPHACPLAVYIHGNGRQQTCDLDTANSYKCIFSPVGIKPIVEEQREHKTVKDV